MAKYETQHFTPTSTEDSAYSWDRLADRVIGHVPNVDGHTAHDTLVKALQMLSIDDRRLLQTILDNVPEYTTRHLHTALQHARRGV